MEAKEQHEVNVADYLEPMSFHFVTNQQKGWISEKLLTALTE